MTAISKINHVHIVEDELLVKPLSMQSTVFTQRSTLKSIEIMVFLLDVPYRIQKCLFRLIPNHILVKFFAM